jgi:hypothetical protein
MSGGLDKVWVKAQPLDTAGVSPAQKQLLALIGKIPQSKIDPLACRTSLSKGDNPKVQIGGVL